MVHVHVPASSQVRMVHVHVPASSQVRAFGREMFQAQRDAVAAREKEKQAVDATVIAHSRVQYMEKQHRTKEQVAGLRASAKAARDSLEEERRQEAARLRGQLGVERERAQQEVAELHTAKKGLRDAVKFSSLLPVVV